MGVPIIQLRSRVPDAQIAKRKGTRLHPEDYVAVLTSDCDVFKPDGSPLCKYRRAAVSEDNAETARPILRQLAIDYGSDNRGSYAGFKVKMFKSRTGNKAQSRTVDEHGKVMKVNSAIAGYFEPVRGRLGAG